MYQDQHERRTLSVRLGARALLSAGLLLGASAIAAAAQVELFVTATRPFAPPGSPTTITVTAGNRGQATTSAVQVMFATPAYVNMDRNRPLPADCRFEYLNPDRTVPELVLCTFSGLGSGQQRALVFQVVVHPLAPAAGVIGLATVLPGPGSVDTDAQIENNYAVPGVSVGRSTIRNGRNNLSLTGDYPAIGGFRPATQTFVVRNNGPAATIGRVTFSFAMPFFVNVDRIRPLPPGCGFLYQNASPGVPELVQCQTPGALGVGASHTFAMPLTRVVGGPVGNLAGIAVIRVDDAAGDADPDRNDNTFVPVVNSLTPILPTVASGAIVDGAMETFVSPLSDPGSANAMDDSAPDAASPTLSAIARATGGARVDLNMAFSTLAIPLGGVGTQTVTVGNQGENATGPVRLVYLTPRGANIDRNAGLPAGCRFLYENLDHTIQEIVECILPGPRRGETISRSLPLEASSQTVPTIRLGTAIVMPATGSADADQFVRDNIVHPLLVLNGSAPTPLPGNSVDLYVSVTLPNVLVNRPGVGLVTVGNKGPRATQGVTRVTFSTPPFVNIDRDRALPSGCSFLFENLDPIVPEIVECLIATPIVPGAEIALAIPYRLAVGGPSGVLLTSVIARPQPGSGDAEVNLFDNSLALGVVASQLAPHTLTLYLHGFDAPHPAGGFTMNQTPTSSSLTVNLLNGMNWFSDPALVGTFDADATFTVVIPCVLGLSLGSTSALAITNVNGGSVRPLGQASGLVSLCLGTQRIPIPVLTPLTIDNELLRLRMTDLLGVSVRLPPGTHLEGTNFRGTP